MSSRTWPSRASPPSQLRSQTLRIRREITGITCRPLGRDPILTTALRSVAKAVPSPCLSNAFVAKAVPLPCVFPMISWLRQCLRLVFFSAFVAEAVPFLAGLRSVLATTSSRFMHDRHVEDVLLYAESLGYSPKTSVWWGYSVGAAMVSGHLNYVLQHSVAEHVPAALVLEATGGQYCKNTRKSKHVHHEMICRAHEAVGIFRLRLLSSRHEAAARRQVLEWLP